jgi:DNA repair exonuclease SbcCD ATPase subunit
MDRRNEVYYHPTLLLDRDRHRRFDEELSAEEREHIRKEISQITEELMFLEDRLDYLMQQTPSRDVARQIHNIEDQIESLFNLRQRLRRQL